MSTAEIRFVTVDSVGDPSQLEPLARAVFGEEQRPRDWFAKKLGRECVVPTRSLLLTQSLDAKDAAAWVGYGLLGRPPSLGPLARTAGIGLIPGWRGRGLGARLVEELRSAAQQEGAQGLLIPASPGAVAFYERCGLTAHRTTHTLWASGVGDDATPAPSPEPWDGPCPGPIRSGWFAEAWERTPPRGRHTLRLCGGTERFDVSMEGSAQLAMRWTSQDGGTAGPSAWLRTMGSGTAALLHDLPASAPELPALLARGWSVAQTTVTMLRRWSQASE